MKRRAVSFVRIGCALGLAVSCWCAGGCHRNIFLLPEDTIATCSVTRVECSGYTLSSSGDIICPVANQFPVSLPEVTVCFFEPTESAQHACDRYCNDFYEFAPGDKNECQATVTATADAPPGLCLTTSTTAAGASAHVTCTVGGTSCTQTTSELGKTFCSKFTGNLTETGDTCFDPRTQTGEQACQNNFMSKVPGVGMLHEHWVDETGVQLTTSMCPPPINIGTITTSLGVAPGSVGSAVYSGTSTTLDATGGSMVVQTKCDSDGEFCEPAELSSMRVTFNDIVVQGTPVTNLDGHLAAPAPVAAITSSGVPTIAAADFQFEVVGTVMGGTSRMQFTPTRDITLAVGGQTATLTGQFDVLVDAPDKIIVPVTTSVTVNASTSNPGAACAGFTSLESLLGFEDLDLWSSTQSTLSLSPSLHTQGCYGINVAGSGYMVLNSAPFATPLPGLTSTAALDVFVPPGQPNPFWLGAVQMYASCPSAGLNNAYLGQAELTGKPTGAFSTVTYALPSNVTTALSQPHADCFFSIAVNVNATPSPVVLDNLRFVH